jgi:DNA-binding transcriptional MerR regulator
MQIGELADRSGVPRKTIRFWEDEGLIPNPDRTPSGYRVYDAEILDRLAFIRAAQGAGLTLEQIREILVIGESGEPPCAHVAELVARRLAEVNARIAELARTRDHLTALARRAAGTRTEGLPGLLLDHHRLNTAVHPLPNRVF